MSQRAMRDAVRGVRVGRRRSSVATLAGLAAAVAGIAGVGASVAHAQATYTWDNNGTSPTNPQDGSTPVAAPWNATDVRWSDGTTDVAWPNTGNEVAVFGNNNGAAGAVYPAFAAQFAGITFNKPGSGAYNLGGFTGGSVTLTGDAPKVTVNASNATISSVINGTGGFVKEGTGTLVITQTQNTFTGPVTINAGTVNVVEGNTVTATGAIKGVTRFDLVNSSITGASGYPTLTLSNGNPAIGGLGTAAPINVTFAGAVAGGDYRAGIASGPNAGHTVSGAITTSGTSSGTLVLGGSGSGSVITFTGAITMAGSERQALSLNAGGAQLIVKGNIDMTGLTQGGQIVLGGSSTSTLTGAITAGSNVDVVLSRSTFTTGFALSSTSTTNTWGNTYIEQGNLVLGTSDGMPASTILTMGKAGAGQTATYQMNGQSQTVSGLQTAAATAGILKVTNTSATTLGGTLTINTAAGTSYTYGTTPGAQTGTIEGSLNVTKSGPGTQTFTGANKYTGLTKVTGGSLVLTKDAFTPANLTGTGGADVTGGRLVFDYSGGGTNPVAEVAAALKASHDASPAWSTGQIKSSAADAAHGLGYYDDGSAVTVTYTYVGDLNLDGRVDADDYVLLDRGLAKYNEGAIASGTEVWVNGDVNYDRVVDSADYMLVDAVYATTGAAHDISALLAEREAQFGRAYASQLAAAVPEPTALAVVAGALGLVGGRRRRGR